MKARCWRRQNLKAGTGRSTQSVTFSVVFKGYPGAGNAISFQGFETHTECKHSRIARRRRQKALAEALRESYTDCRHQCWQRERRRRQGGAAPAERARREAPAPAERAPAPAERAPARAGREVAGSGAGRVLCCFGICYAANHWADLAFRSMSIPKHEHHDIRGAHALGCSCL